MKRAQPARTSDYDVIIVGAGPVGLTLAALLRGSGRATLVVERRRAVLAHGRAMHLDRSSVELLSRAGMVWQCGIDLDPLAGVSFESATGGEFRIALGALCPDAIAPFAFFQPAVERALIARLERSSVELCFGTEVTGVGLHGDLVRVELREAPDGAGRQARAPLVVGCDGANSMVRSAARLPFRRWLSGAQWRASDHRLRRPLPDRLVRHRLEREPTTVVPGCGPFARFEARVPDGSPAAVACGTTAAEAAFGVEIEQTMASRAYRYDTRIAARTHRTVGGGSVLIMGDAAHTVAPFLGQGLGLGLRDAAQLAALLAPGCGDAATIVDRYARARRRDVMTTATQSMLAQLLVESGGRWAPHRLDRVLRTLSRRTAAAPGVMQHLALAHRRLHDGELTADAARFS